MMLRAANVAITVTIHEEWETRDDAPEERPRSEGSLTLLLAATPLFEMVEASLTLLLAVTPLDVTLEALVEAAAAEPVWPLPDVPEAAAAATTTIVVDEASSVLLDTGVPAPKACEPSVVPDPADCETAATWSFEPAAGPLSETTPLIETLDELEESTSPDVSSANPSELMVESEVFTPAEVDTLSAFCPAAA